MPQELSRKPIVVVTRKLLPQTEKKLASLFDVRLNSKDVPFNHKQLCQAVSKSDALVPTLTDRIDASVLLHASKNLRLITNFGAGVDHIDITTAGQLGITVTNTPDVLTEDTADTAIILLLSLPRRLAEGQRLVTSGTWAGWSPTSILGQSVAGKTLGIIGMGRIGQAVAQRALSFGFKIHYHNRRRLPQKVEKTLTAQYWPNLDAMLSKMDFISVNCPHTPATFHLLSARRLKRLKSSCYIVNTSRGEVIDQSALTRMLANQEIAGAGLDVYEYGPTIPPSLMELDNVVLLPHMGSATVEGRISMGEKVINNMKTFFAGSNPPDKISLTMF